MTTNSSWCGSDVGAPVVFDWVALKLIGLGFRRDCALKISSLSFSEFPAHRRSWYSTTLHYRITVARAASGWFVYTCKVNTYILLPLSSSLLYSIAKVFDPFSSVESIHAEYSPTTKPPCSAYRCIASYGRSSKVYVNLGREDADGWTWQRRLAGVCEKVQCAIRSNSKCTHNSPANSPPIEKTADF
ncbi:hypothetical protein CBL_07375 [Carabus blaptoides fortunei]